MLDYNCWHGIILASKQCQAMFCGSGYWFLAKIHFWNHSKYSTDNKKRLTNFWSFKHYLEVAHLSWSLLYYICVSYVDINHLSILGFQKLYWKSHDEWNLNKCHVPDCQFVTQKCLPHFFVPPHFEVEFSTGDFVWKKIRNCFPNVILYLPYMKYFLTRSKFTIVHIQNFFMQSKRIPRGVFPVLKYNFRGETLYRYKIAPLVKLSLIMK